MSEMTTLLNQVSPADMIFCGAGFLGMVAHYIKRVVRKETSSTVVGYFGKDDLNATLTTLTAFVMAMLGALSSGVIASDCTIWTAIYAGLTTGFAVDSGFNTGAPHQPAEPATK